jgi:hypothetical protein
MHAEMRITGSMTFKMPATTGAPQALTPQTHPQPGRLPKPGSPRCDTCDRAQRSLRVCTKCGMAICGQCTEDGTRCVCYQQDAPKKQMKAQSKCPLALTSASRTSASSSTNSKMAAMRAVPAETRYQELRQYYGPKGKGGMTAASHVPPTKRTHIKKVNLYSRAPSAAGSATPIAPPIRPRGRVNEGTSSRTSDKNDPTLREQVTYFNLRRQRGQSDTLSGRMKSGGDQEEDVWERLSRGTDSSNSSQTHQ